MLLHVCSEKFELDGWDYILCNSLEELSYCRRSCARIYLRLPLWISLSFLPLVRRTFNLNGTVLLSVAPDLSANLRNRS